MSPPKKARHFGFSLAVSITMLFAIIGCTERNDPLTPVNEDLLVLGRSQQQVRAEISDIPDLPRFRLSVGPAGVVRAGHAITLDISVRALVTSPRALVRVHAPEVVQHLAARASDPALGQTVSPLLSYEQRLSAGEVDSRRVTIPPVPPGYYTVVLAAQELGAPRATDKLSDVAVATLFLLVTDSGGVVTPSFQPDRIPAGFRRQPGPFRSGAEEGFLSLEACEPDVEWCEEEPPPSRPCCVFGTALYLHQVSGQYLPLRRARIHLSYPNGQLYTATTSESGEFGGLGCAYPSETGTLNVLLVNSDVRITAENAGYDFVNESDCGTPMTFTTVSSEARVFDNFVRTVDDSRAYFGRARGFIDVTVTATENNSFYRPWEDRIYILATHIWGQFADFVHPHEYGHAFHAVAFSHGNQGSGACGSHSIGEAINGACAYSEGFADYHATALGATYFAWSIEENPWAQSNPGGTPQIEGAVAAYFLDITDGTNAAEGDDLALPGSFLSAVISECEVDIWSGFYEYINTWGWVGPDYILHFRYCFENRLGTFEYPYVPPSVPPSTISVRFSPYSVSFPPTWSQASMNSLFLRTFPGF